jgi:hypothetical protein
MSIPSDGDNQLSWDEVRRRVKVHLLRIKFSRANRAAEAQQGHLLIEIANDRMSRVAWSPLSSPDKIRLTSILCPANQAMDRLMYLSFLGDRVQSMVDAWPEPAELVWQLQEEMFRTGLVREIGYCPSDQAGSRLIEGNPNVEEKLSQLGVFRALSHGKNVPTTDDLAARRALQAEKEDPADGLLMWASQIAAVQ